MIWCLSRVAEAKVAFCWVFGSGAVRSDFKTASRWFSSFLEILHPSFKKQLQSVEEKTPRNCASFLVPMATG